MARNVISCANAARLKTAKNGGSPKAGTVLANYSDTRSCDLAQPSDGQRGAWGGARNRANRASNCLTDKQVAALMEAARYAIDVGRVFQRHWIVHYGKAGIQPSDGARFVGKLLDLVSKQARREGGALTALWVRERASEKGEHVHILMHLPAAMRLHGRTRRWIEAGGGQWQLGVSRIRIIGGRLNKFEQNRSKHHAKNAANVTRYLLKAASKSTGQRLELTRAGCCGRITGKRCGWTQNIGAAARGRGNS